MQHRKNPFKFRDARHVGIRDGIDHFRRVRHTGTFQHDHGGSVVLHELSDAPGQIVFGVATDAAAGEVEDLLGDRAGAWSIDTDFARLVHEHADLMALAVPEFEEAHEQGGLARAERSAQDVKGNGECLRLSHAAIVTAGVA